MEKIFGGVQNHSGGVNKYSGGVRTPPENPSMILPAVIVPVFIEFTGEYTQPVMSLCIMTFQKASLI